MSGCSIAVTNKVIIKLIIIPELFSRKGLVLISAFADWLLKGLRHKPCGYEVGN
jgi:hypothetical protein